MTMTTELDELATRAANDRSLSNSGLDQVIVSVIQKTRQQWVAMSDENLSHDASLDSSRRHLRVRLCAAAVEAKQAASFSSQT